MITRRWFVASAAALGSVLAKAKSFAAGIAPQPTGADAAAVLNQTKQAAGALTGRIIFRDDPSYDNARGGAIWNARKPQRYPLAIVMAESADDVVAAVRLARANGLQVGVRSTGHSWVSPHTRDNVILINMSRMQDISIDAAAMTAVVSPAVEGQIFNLHLREQKLMFPTGHCFGVGLGGYILGGGLGWNSRVWGPACANLMALDVVTASGDLIHADEHNNSDYLWAARGAGPGFFGVVVRYYLKVYPLPPVMRASGYVYPIEVFEPLYAWLRDTTPEFPKILEIFAIGRVLDNVPRLRISGVAIGDSEEEVTAALAFLDKCPVLDQAISKSLDNHVLLPGQVELPTAVDKHGYRFAVDNMWTNAPAAELVPRLKEVFTVHPTPTSYALWQCWGKPVSLPDMAFSVQGEIYISCNLLYKDPADDAKSDAWVTGHMKQLEDLAAGSFINDENMIGRNARYFSEEATRKLAELQDRYDPDRVFVSFLTA